MNIISRILNVLKNRSPKDEKALVADIRGENTVTMYSSAWVKDCELCGYNLIYPNAQLNNCHLGFGSYINGGTTLNDVFIGAYSSVSSNVKMIRGKHPSGFVSTYPGFYSNAHEGIKTYADGVYFQEFEDKKYNGYSTYIGNGPSMKEQDLTCLNGEILFTVNQFMRADYSKTLRPSYHFWADPAFFSEDEVNSAEVTELMSAVPEDTVTFFDSIGYDFVTKNGIDKKIKCSFFMKGLSVSDLVSAEFDGLVSNCSTVVQYAVLMAIYMGFTEIYLLGCDMTGIITMIQAKEKSALDGGYSYEMSATEKQRVSNLASSVSMESQFLGWGRMCTGYRILGEYCREHGILLANSTRGGVLDNLPRVSLESLF